MYDPNPVKSDANRVKHGVPFDLADSFAWDSAIEARDVRRTYDEVRTMAVGFVADDLYVMIFTRRGQKIRIISLRRANRREVRSYVDFHR